VLGRLPTGFRSVFGGGSGGRGILECAGGPTLCFSWPIISGMTPRIKTAKTYTVKEFRIKIVDMSPTTADQGSIGSNHGWDLDLGIIQSNCEKTIA
jgi:hypothetical protein